MVTQPALVCVFAELHGEEHHFDPLLHCAWRGNELVVDHVVQLRAVGRWHRIIRVHPVVCGASHQQRGDQRCQWVCNRRG